MDIAFLYPWILAGLAVLPLIWLILRITPPPPRNLMLPSARFLKGLIPEKASAAQTPWWLLLLRLIIAALVIVALASPILNPTQSLPDKGPLRLVMDNGWSSAPIWDKKIKEALEIISKAGQEKRDIEILATTSEAGQNAPQAYPPMSASKAASIIKALKPQSWSPDYKKVISNIKAEAYTYFLSDGIKHRNFDLLYEALKEHGNIQIVSPAPSSLPVILTKAKEEKAHTLSTRIEVPAGFPSNFPLTVLLSATNGAILDKQTVTVDKINEQTGGGIDVHFELPQNLLTKAAHLNISGYSSAASVLLLDTSYQKRRVGIAVPSQEEQSTPFIDSGFYLDRALEPYAIIKNGSLEELLTKECSVLILPDITAIGADTLNKLEKWVKNGGTLLRFAGPNMTRDSNGAQTLLPVQLRSGGRSMEGNLSWEKPQKIAPFPEGSPLFGIPLYDDITIAQQVLAQPETTLKEKTWATLEDGTPLITAQSKEKGLIILVHTSASSDWSDMPLSGTYVEILRRIIKLSSSEYKDNIAVKASLMPQRILDGYGSLQAPFSAAKPLLMDKLQETIPSSLQPPGIYTSGSYTYAFNMGENIKNLSAIDIDYETHRYGLYYETGLMPYLIFAAAFLFLLDGFIILFMLRHSIFSFRKRLKINMLILIFFAALSLDFPAAHAQESPSKNAAPTQTYADDLRLAYIQTGNPNIDSIAQAGLENLATALRQRTSAEPVGVAPLNPEYDPLEFFPLIYWPISITQEKLSDKALAKIQFYIDHGGTIIFDLLSPNDSGAQNALRQLMAGLNIPPLIPISDDHVLHKTFYLLDDFPGQYHDETVWLEKPSKVKSGTSRDGVSSVIIGAHNWAGAWANANPSPTGQYNQPRQNEFALRTGINMVIYALTGNYKADQVHVKEILKRMGR